MSELADFRKEVIAIIPARYGSTRLPGKPLKDVCGKPLIQRVWEAALQSRLLSRIIIATDDERIADCCMNFGAEFVMTDSELPSGSDRIHQAYQKIESEAEYVLNIQGDEPLITGELIDELILQFDKSDSDVATLIKRIESDEDLFNNNVVKVVVNDIGHALYFSRTTMPFLRDIERETWGQNYVFWKHIGVYLYKIDSLNKFVELPQSQLEMAEKLEQLRLMENGEKYFCMQTDINPVGVDTEEDLEWVRKIFEERLSK
jgi:3-deoxy-manno-octulosonate cytidylyltransferase (CMP-KDO synthetase)